MIRYLALAFALVLAVPAFATDWDWDLNSSPSTARRAHARHVRHYYRHVNIEADKDRDRHERERADNGWQCLDKVRGLGTQWIGTEGALEAAKKDWMERVRYDHGESYIDMTNARDFESRCGRVSIGEVAGQVTYRCEIMARPCKPPMKETAQSTK
ncbi:MAG TPA: hypothetical protein VLW88_09645 [Hyphomicrobium sp.]|jgi:hypothetical protein|nr:hypothetical protein [Hyphomicrobium sp.]